VKVEIRLRKVWEKEIVSSQGCLNFTLPSVAAIFVSNRERSGTSYSASQSV